MLLIIVALLVGIVIGTITGLTPGLHINLVATLLTSTTFALTQPLAGAVFIASLAVTHTIIDFIPSIFLGAAEESTFLSILPGHALLKEGHGYEAATIAIIGSLAGTIIGVVASPAVIPLLSKLQELTITIIPLILIAILTYSLLREDSPLKALIYFTLAGLLGFLATNLPINEPLLPLLSGLFGASGLIISVNKKVDLPPQKIVPLRQLSIPPKDLIKTTIIGSVTALPFSLLPALGSGYGSFCAAEVTKQTPRGFLFLNGLMSAIVMALSIPIAAHLNKVRTGAAAGISELVGAGFTSALPTILISMAITALIAATLGLMLAKQATNMITRISYKKISLTVLAIVTYSVALFSGPIGLLVYVTGTALGMAVVLSNIRRTTLMGSLLVPTLLFYLV